MMRKTVYRSCLVLVIALLWLFAHISSDGGHAYISNGNSDSISVIDTASGKVVATWPAGIDPEGVALSPDGARLYAVNENGGTVTVINTKTGTVMATIEG